MHSLSWPPIYHLFALPFWLKLREGAYSLMIWPFFCPEERQTLLKLSRCRSLPGHSSSASKSCSASIQALAWPPAVPCSSRGPHWHWSWFSSLLRCLFAECLRPYSDRPCLSCPYLFRRFGGAGYLCSSRCPSDCFCEVGQSAGLRRSTSFRRRGCKLSA